MGNESCVPPHQLQFYPDKLLHDDMVILEQVSGESEADDTEE